MNTTTNTVWKTIWKLQIPRVVQLFLWRACNKILPKTSRHLLWWSRVSIKVWAGSSRLIQKCVTQEGNFLTIFEDLSSRLEIEELELVAMIAQRL